MAFLITKADLRTNIYTEIIDEITRGDDTITQEAIDAAIGEAKGFLKRYDLAALFGSANANPTFSDATLKGKVKDIVRMNLVNLGCASIDTEFALAQYRNAITLYFREIQRGNITPEGWPYVDTSTATAPPAGSAVKMTSNPKRDNHF